MALATQCPHCHTTFRVAADQLKLRGGIVRCGACKQVFDGNAALVDFSPPVVAPVAVPVLPLADAAQARSASSLTESLAATPGFSPAESLVAMPGSSPADMPSAKPASSQADSPAAAPAFASAPDAGHVASPASSAFQSELSPTVESTAPSVSESETPSASAHAEAASLSAAFDAEMVALEARQQSEDKARAEEASSSEPIYVLDFDTTYDPFGIMPKTAAVAEIALAEVPADFAPETPAPAPAPPVDEEFEEASRHDGVQQEASSGADAPLAAPGPADQPPYFDSRRDMQGSVPPDEEADVLPDAPSNAEIARAVSQLSEVDVANAVDDLLNDELMAVAQPDDDALSDEELTDEELARAGLLHIEPAPADVVSGAAPRDEVAEAGLPVDEHTHAESAHEHFATDGIAQHEPVDGGDAFPHAEHDHDDLAGARTSHDDSADDQAEEEFTHGEQTDHEPSHDHLLTSQVNQQPQNESAPLEPRPFKPAADGLAPMLMRASAATEPAPPAAPAIPPLAERYPPRKGKRRAPSTDRRVEPPVAAPEPPPVEVDEPEFVKQSRIEEASGHTRRMALAGGAVLLALLLVLQAAGIFRNVLAARYPSLKPALVTLCAPFGCKVELPAQTDALSVEAGELQPTGSGTFLFTSLLRNQSELTQAWPNLALELTDDNNKPLVRRVFTPAEYLPAGSAAAKGFGARSEQAVRLNFALDQLKASGYTIAVFYP
jgi:predicted Zn finger-like uncharacterized protein